MKQYLKRTWKNKVVALLIMLPGLIPVWLDGDATVLVLTLIAATPLFFAKQNYIE
jgi:hypothetical protein